MLLTALAVLAAVLSLQPGAAIPPGNENPMLTWSPGNPEPGRDVTFSGAAHDPDGLITSMTLEYGDGTQDKIVVPRSLTKDLAACVFGDYFAGTFRHRYSQAGDYPVKVTVTSGACPLTDALQDTVSWKSFSIKVSKQTSSAVAPAEAAEAAVPGGGASISITG